MTEPNLSIVVVEDDENDQFFISRAFKEAGVTANLELMSDGQSAIDYFERLAKNKNGSSSVGPRLVLLDLNLPRKSGLEVLKWIRESEWMALVVIVLTSSTSEYDIQQAYQHGANAYTIKPADPTKLRDFARLIKEFWLTWNQIPTPRRDGPPL